MSELLDPLYILFHLINLVVMFLILKKFLYRPVKKFMAQRQQQYESQKKDAEDALNQAQQKMAEAEQAVADAKQEAKRIIHKANDDAAEQTKAIVDHANKQAQERLAAADTAIERKQSHVQEEVRSASVEIGVALAKSILQREINPDDHQRIIDEYLEKVTEHAQ